MFRYRTLETWAPIESIRWVMTGAGIQDAEWLYALQRQRPASALLERARALATHFAVGWNPSCQQLNTSSHVKDFGDDGYAFGVGAQNGSSLYNDLRLDMIEELVGFAASQ
jgi:hypothetical protein